MRTLVSGASSGLGKFLAKSLGGDTFSRFDTINDKSDCYDVIIHAAFPRAQKITYSSYGGYIKDTLHLTKDLLKIPHKKFIYISSVDVYPKHMELVSESSCFEVGEISTLYGHYKLLSEMCVRENSSNFVILRLSALLGEGMRPNSLIKIMENVPSITLSGSSSFNYILYEDVLSLVKEVMLRGERGVFNVVSSGNITLKEMSRYFFSSTKFGSFEYKTPTIDNTKALKLSDALYKTSLMNIKLLKESILY